ncbi:MAG: hypothetical protein MH137_04260 [Flavobacteriales bacterium]|nr:hypothetical protein [Flavobacteriales bacterium]
MENKPNFFIYSENKFSYTAASLIAFGYDVYRNSKIIKDFGKLKKITHDLNISPHSTDSHKLIQEFMFEYLIDSIRILIFFENYMKARLIYKGFIVHLIKDEDPFKKLRKKQFKEPVLYGEIQVIEPFIMESGEFHTNSCLSDKTLGMSILLKSGYTMHYNIDFNLLKFIGELNKYRNRLHFSDKYELTLNQEFLKNLSELIVFVNKVMLQLQKKP